MLRTKDPEQCFPDVRRVDPFWLSKITTDSYTPAHINIVCPDDRNGKLKYCNSEVILDSYKYISLAYATVHCMI